jgi:mannose-6-phosphate isomerase-like protein (cupin superfamily)
MRLTSTHSPPSRAATSGKRAGEGERLADEYDEYLITSVLRSRAFSAEVRTGHADRGAHRHERHVESFSVLAGHLEFTFECETVDAGEGTSVVIPRALRHALRNSAPHDSASLECPRT